MAFDVLAPNPRGTRVGVSDAVRVAVQRKGARKTLTVQILIGSKISDRLGWAPKETVQIEVGQAESADRGKLRIGKHGQPAFRLSQPGAAGALRVTTASLHPSFNPAEHAMTPTAILSTEGGVLLIKLPETMLRTGSLMGDGVRRRP